MKKFQTVRLIFNWGSWKQLDENIVFRLKYSFFKFDIKASGKENEKVSF